MASEDAVKSFKALCDQITKTPVDALVSNPDWGRINFENARNELTLVFAIANQLKNLPIEMLPDGEFGPLNQALTAVSNRIQGIRAFSIEQGNAPQTRDGIITQLRNEVANLYNHAQLRMPFLALQRGDVRRNEEALADAVERANHLVG